MNKAKKIGTQGYCMGGPLVFRTAATLPDRIGAGASFHGGGLVTDRPGQPAPARAEDQGADVHRRRLERRRAAAGREGQAEGSVRRGEGAGGDRGLSGAARLVRARHAERRRAQPIYNKPDAEKAWAKLVALYKAALA